MTFQLFADYMIYLVVVSAFYKKSEDTDSGVQIIVSFLRMITFAQ